MTLAERCKKVMPPMAGRVTDLGIVKAEGCWLTTENGDRILDFASGIAVCNLGHNHPAVIAAAEAQMKKLVHGCHNVLYYEPYVELAEKLVELTGGGTKVYFSNSGAEANDGAVKLAKYVTGRPGIIAFKGSFHGRTLGAVSLTASSAHYRKNIESSLMPNVYHLDYPYLLHTPFPYDGEHTPRQYFDQFEDLFHTLIAPESVAAIVMEPVQGEGGYIVPSPDWMRYVRKLCDTYGICLIFDEVQTGFGRTGKLFAYEHFGVTPDILTCAKGIANGFPLSAIIATAELMDQWPAGAHGGTFGGNPVACAAALATIKELKGGAIAHGAEMGGYLMEKLRALQSKYPRIAELRGLGLMIGMELLEENGAPAAELTKAVQKKTLEKALLLLPCGTYKNVIRFIAPLLVAPEEIDRAVAIVDAVMQECC